MCTVSFTSHTPVSARPAPPKVKRTDSADARYSNTMFDHWQDVMCEYACLFREVSASRREGPGPVIHTDGAPVDDDDEPIIVQQEAAPADVV